MGLRVPERQLYLKLYSTNCRNHTFSCLLIFLTNSFRASRSNEDWFLSKRALNWDSQNALKHWPTVGTISSSMMSLPHPQDLPSGQKFYSRDLLRQRVTILNPYDVLFVKVFCPLDELERREIAREDRIIGLARFQFDLVHQHAIYDVEVDTFRETPETSVVRVLDALRNPKKSSAFALMHDELIR